VANAGDDISVSATLSDSPGVTSITALGISSTTFHGKVELIKPAVDAVTINTSSIDLGTNLSGTQNTKGLMINGRTIDLELIRIPPLPTPPAASATAQVKETYNQALIAAMPAYRTAMLDIAKAINDKAGLTQVTARLSDDSRNLILGSIANDANPKIRITGSFATDSAGSPIVAKKDPLAHVPQAGTNLGQDSVKNSEDQYTYQDNVFGIGNGSWPAEPINTVTIKRDQVNFDKPLYIKDSGVWKKVTMFGVETLEDMATNISNSGAGVKATVNALGDLEISNDELHRGQDIRTSAIASDATGTSLVTALGQIATTFRVKYDFKPSGPIQLGFGAGSPAQLAQLGFRTGAFVTGEVKDDLLIFVTGPGNAAVSATYSGQAADAKQNLRSQSLNVQFFQDPAKYKGALYYKISSTDLTKPAQGATVVAERIFNPEMLNPGVSFQGLNIAFTGVPKANDVFKLDGNKDGLGNNDNLLVISELETKAVVGSKTMTNSYIDQVNEMGNIARQAAISQTALKVVNEQAIKSRDEISGVSLDKEAADLIRYQQAYQASAKVLQIASQLFEAVLRV
jgi:flagellar hook protein FlgE